MSIASKNKTIILEHSDGRSETLTVLKVMREIEERRFSGHGIWEGQDVFFKVFVAIDRVDKHVQREIAGSELLIAKKIPTAEILCQASVHGEGIPQGAQCLLYRWIENAENVHTLLNGRISETRALALLRQLAETIGTHHHHGLIQKDIHFGNFAVVENEIYTFDPGSVEVKGPPISKSAALDNLALFFAQIDPVYVNTSTLSMLLEAYLESKGGDRERPDSSKLWRRIQKERRKRIDRFLDKVLRSCRLVVVHKLESGRKILLDRAANQEDLKSLVEEIDGKESVVDGTAFEYDARSIQLRLFTAEGGSLFGFGDHDPATRSWRMAKRLALQGVAVVPQLACVCDKQNPWILEDCPPGSTIESVLSTHPEDTDRVAGQIAETLVRLDQLNLVHGNMSKRCFASWDGSTFLKNLECLVEGKERELDATQKTSSDMRDLLKVWKDEAFGDSLLGALNGLGYALDIEIS